MIKCPHCGGELDFDIKDQVVKCPYCESEFNPKKEIAKVKSSVERKATEYDTGVTKGKCYTCSQCGAQLVTFDDTAVTFCNYCDSQALIESEMNMLNPKVIIPFKKTKEEAVDLYLKKIKSSLFAPNSFKNDIILKKFRGIYMPYEIYDVECHDTFSSEAEKYSHRSGDYVFYNTYKITGNIDSDYDGLSYDVSSSYSDDVSQAIPFDFKEAEEFNHNYLVGNYADTSDVDSSIYDDNAAYIVNEDLRKEVCKRKELISYTLKGFKVNSRVDNKRKGFFPVYFASFKNKAGNRIHYAVINGQTGKSAVDIPVDYIKVLIASLIVAIPIYFLLDSITTITPDNITRFSLIALVFELILQSIDLKQINAKEKHLNDEGYGFKNKNNKVYSREELIKNNYGKGPKTGGIAGTMIFFAFMSLFIGSALNNFWIIIGGITGSMVLMGILINKKTKKYEKEHGIPEEEKIKGYNKLIYLTAIIPILILFVKPVEDNYYYGASILALTIIHIIFRLIIKKHNTFIARPLPQLNKRGGDMNE